MKALLLLSVLLAAISIGSALKCYVCAGTGSSDCAKGKSKSMSIVNCKAPGLTASHRTYSYIQEALEDFDSSAYKPVCLSLTETEYQPNLFVRGCGFFPNNVDPCQILQEDNILNCKSCKTDMCNERREHDENDFEN